MFELTYIATEGYSVGMVIAWVFLLLMCFSISCLILAMVADSFYEWFDNREHRKQQNPFYSK